MSGTPAWHSTTSVTATARSPWMSGRNPSGWRILDDIVRRRPAYTSRGLAPPAGPVPAATTNARGGGWHEGFMARGRDRDRCSCALVSPPVALALDVTAP